MQAEAVQLFALPEIPLVGIGDELSDIVLEGMMRAALEPQDGDIVVLAQKIVSKAEGRVVDLASVTPSERAIELAVQSGKDARLVELILQESDEILRVRRDVIIVAHRLGFVMANAGIDMSNVDHSAGESALLLPRSPDETCTKLHEALFARTGRRIGVCINDSHGRAWRNGTVGVALGCAGMTALRNLRGQPDLFGRSLLVTEVGHADEVAAAASLLMGQADEGRPIVLIRGLSVSERGGAASELVRDKRLDLFR